MKTLKAIEHYNNAEREAKRITGFSDCEFTKFSILIDEILSKKLGDKKSLEVLELVFESEFGTL